MAIYYVNKNAYLLSDIDGLLNDFNDIKETVFGFEKQIKDIQKLIDFDKIEEILDLKIVELQEDFNLTSIENQLEEFRAYILDISTRVENIETTINGFG